MTANADTFEEGVAAYERDDFATALQIWRPLAENGDPHAQNRLGDMYENWCLFDFEDQDEEEFEEQTKEAVKWYRKAAEQGFIEGQSSLGSMYEHGKGVPQDIAEAVKWYSLAAEQGDLSTQFHLGRMYFYGMGLSKDYAEAVKWFSMAAEQGEVRAQMILGGIYIEEFGEEMYGIPQDLVEADKWFFMASEQGDADAQFALGEVCLKFDEGGHPGDNIMFDRSSHAVHAAQFFNIAAEQGHIFARARLGELYEKGKGVPQDFALAHMWSNLAAAHIEQAQNNRDNIAERMTPDQIAEAQRMAREWLAKHQQ